MPGLTESLIEQAAIEWLKDLGYTYAFGLEITFDRGISTLASLHDTLLTKMMRVAVPVVE